jgi:hypothetical protein
LNVPSIVAQWRLYVLCALSAVVFGPKECPASGLPANAFENFPSLYDRPSLDVSFLELPYGFLSLFNIVKGIEPHLQLGVMENRPERDIIPVRLARAPSVSPTAEANSARICGRGCSPLRRLANARPVQERRQFSLARLE